MKRLIRRICLSLVALPLLLLASSGIASAHVLKESHGISAVLHIPPDDNPTAGEQAELDFSFGDDANTFSLPDCNCQVTVKSDTKTIIQTTPKPALQGATLDSIVNVTFPAAGVYHVIVQGSARHGNFQTFQLDYLVRVAQPAGAADKSGQGSQVIIIGFGSLAILGLFASTNMRTGGRYVTHEPSKSKSTKRRN